MLAWYPIGLQSFLPRHLDFDLCWLLLFKILVMNFDGHNLPLIFYSCLCFFESAILLLIARLLSDPSLLPMLPLLFDTLSYSSFFIEIADSIVIVLSTALPVIFYKRTYVALISWLSASAISGEWERTLVFSSPVRSIFDIKIW